MLKSILISQRDLYTQRVETLQTAIARIGRDCPRVANYRRTIALYRDLITVIDKHDAPKARILEAAE
jgi:hypothetical protein